MAFNEKQIKCNCTELCSAQVCETNGGCLKSVTKTKHGIEVHYKCVEWVPADRPLLCYVNDKNMAKIHAVKCCRDKDYCAQQLDVRLESDDQFEFETDPPNSINGWQIGLIFCLLITLSLILFLIFLYYKYRNKRRIMINQRRRYISLDRLTDSGAEKFLGHYEIGPVHIAQEIKKDALIGRGKFGSVYRCGWKHSCPFVAVKVFNSRHRDAWSREEEIYMTPLFRHDNIVHFIASDSIVTNAGLELWIITRYYEKGSLYDYLQSNHISLAQLSSLAKSIAVGLEFMHNELCGTNSTKPGIAHRDLKSSNIMVHNDGYTCCIGDFGTAARFFSARGELDVPKDVAFGTKRYLAPEILNRSINMNNFDSLRQADIYAMALIFWELCWRTEHFNCINPYQVPYFVHAPNDPTLDDMHNVVCVKKLRPPMLDTWVECEILSNLQAIIKECWADNPAARLPALRIVKRMGDFYLEKFLS